MESRLFALILSNQFNFVILSFFFLLISFPFVISLQNKPLLVEPIDFENFILKNKTLIQNDPQRELLLYPNDDVSVSKLPLIKDIPTAF